MILGNTVFRNKIKIWFLHSALVVIGCWILFMPSMVKFQKGANNIFTVFLNDVEVGTLESREDAYKALRMARRSISDDTRELTLATSNIAIQGSNIIWGEVQTPSEVAEKMAEVLNNSKKTTLARAYSIKINEYSVNLASIDEVMKLLSTALSKYDTENQYDVNLVLDPGREVNVLTTQVLSKEEVKREEEIARTNMPEAGFFATISEIVNEATPLAYDKDFSDYKLGLQSIDFADKIEIVESYLPDDEITDVASAIDEVTKDKETNQIYEVKSGDTLSSIALEYGLTVSDLIAMNESLEDEYTRIRTEDELIVTVPEPELSVSYTVESYYEEDYEAEVQYIDNDSWYTTQTKVIQEPSAGHRKVVALISYTDNNEDSREIEKEEVTYQAVPKIVERGTIVPPTYIKPISGGRLSSGFGKRSAPKKGASTYHKGVDWATPVGTAVVASSSGTVTRAGWGSGYGYCVYIKHPDGRETRYGHLSKVLVSAGAKVTQGQKIALSGNTGVSTGPHLHFEILVNGSQVNPLNYLN
ncbi:M23 family metallopeptidase [Butyrivibrio sp. YAB3001]|uniref:M23 family metallopeptidase n=1 Tax=Butyrivibrio sp. YAB3001 TaxID=1520812 RepID=UPI0008F64725|nr:M23 family metallopeptidase [Butyrivibrio sp. YAB3001]SFC78290.1 Murein DD-endopeptidase MepM and murein hydrolase activator NlpD, contain LysM domain [Butyrivibrio sp. YAB3001]